MSRWAVRLVDAALRDLERLAKPEQRRVLAAIARLAEGARPHPQSRQLKGDLAHARRLRVGEVRVGYVIDEAEHTATVWAIGHRQRFHQIGAERMRQ